MKSYEFRKPIAQIETEQRQAAYQQHKAAKKPRSPWVQAGATIGSAIVFGILARMIKK